MRIDKHVNKITISASYREYFILLQGIDMLSIFCDITLSIEEKLKKAEDIYKSISETKDG